MADKPKHKTCEGCWFPGDAFTQNPCSTEYGERVRCDCGTKYIYGKGMDDYRYLHVICEREDISKKNRRGGIWQLCKTSRGIRIHVTCPSCLAIYEESIQRVNKDGFMGGRSPNSCIDCECGLHFWPYLEGWKNRNEKVRRQTSSNRARKAP